MEFRGVQRFDTSGGVSLFRNKRIIQDSTTGTLYRVTDQFFNVMIRGNQAFVGGGLFNTGRISVSGVTVKSNRALIGRNVFNTSRAILHWQRPRPAHQAKARVSIASQERRSWVASK